MKLSDYLTERKISDSDFADSIKRDATTVWRLKTERTLPDWKTVAAIIDATEGAVTANDFVPTQHEAAH